MSAGARAEQPREEDAYRRMWEEVDNDWDFHTLPANWDEIDEDWSEWDESPGAEALNEDHPAFNPALTSANIDRFTPPPRDRVYGRVVERSNLPITAQPRAAPAPASLSHVGHAQSTITSTRNPPTSQPNTSHHPPAAERPTFLDNVLPPPRTAPEHIDNWLDPPRRHARTTFDYVPDELFETLSESEEESQVSRSSPAPSEAEEEEEDADTMAPSTRRRQRGNNDSVVDLTADATPPSDPRLRHVTRKRRAASPAEPSTSSGSGPSKRRRTSSHRPTTKEEPIEEIDMTTENPSADVELLQSTQSATIAAQQAASSALSDSTGPLRIGKRQCIICMENYTNATVTACGHIYCHECLYQALRQGEKNSEKKVGNCPVCRKAISRKVVKGGSVQVIPVVFMRKSAWRGKARRVLA